MNRFFLAGAAALAFAIPAAAQDMAVTTNGDVYVMTDAQESMYTGWPADRRSAYDTWPRTYQEYYWTLTPTQQSGWWVLTDDQRAKVYAMTPQQRAQAWTAIAAQMSAGTPNANASATAQTATTAASTASTAGPRWVSNAVVQTTPAQTAASGELPICSPDQQDDCINAWEAGKRGPNVTRPLDHWPGRPASEIPGKKPQASSSAD
jgi:hypothetical protein